jgi:hypothetical protein
VNGYAAPAPQPRDFLTSALPPIVGAEAFYRLRAAPGRRLLTASFGDGVAQTYIRSPALIT